MNFLYVLCFVVVLSLQESQGNVLNVCFFCGKQCQKDISDMSTLTAGTEDVVNGILEASGIDMKITITNVKVSKKSHPLKKYSERTKGEDGLANARIKFWKKRFEQMQKKYDCGVGFLLSSSRDRFWKTCPKDGIAGVAGACKKEGTGILKLSTDINTLGTLLAHEIGHQLSMAHDCESVDYLSNMAAIDSQIAELVAPIQKYCGPGKCVSGFIMDPAPLAYSPYPASYSKCSQAYFNFFFNSKNNPLLSQLYNSKCIN